MEDVTPRNLGSFRRIVKRKDKIWPRKTSRIRKPEGLSLEDWQIALRREFGREQPFLLRNLGTEPIFSEFAVTNPTTQNTYRVLVRGCKPGDNYCSCPDFSINTLGTCKHIEFALARLERKRVHRRMLQQGFHPPYSEVYLRYNAKREVAIRLGSSPSPLFQAVVSRYFDAQGQLTPKAYFGFERFLKEAQAAGEEVRCYEEAVAYIAQIRDERRRRELIAKVFPLGVESPAFQRLVKTSLYAYQKEGALFVANAGRCLLADDMGLGKTVQALAASEILSRTVGLERVLVVCPTSLKHQWKQEIEKFTRRSAQVIEGLLDVRARH